MLPHKQFPCPRLRGPSPFLLFRLGLDFQVLHTCALSEELSGNIVLVRRHSCLSLFSNLRDPADQNQGCSLPARSSMNRFLPTALPSTEFSLHNNCQQNHSPTVLPH